MLRKVNLGQFGKAEAKRFRCYLRKMEKMVDKPIVERAETGHCVSIGG